MNKWILVFVLFITGLEAKDYGSVFVDEVVSVYDGDTFRANINNFPPIIGDSIGIRVNGIDTPEIRGKCSREKELAIQARDLAKEKLIGASTVVLKNIQRGKYFRIVADVYVDGENLTDILIGANLGVPYDGGTKLKDWCKN